MNKKKFISILLSSFCSYTYAQNIGQDSTIDCGRKDTISYTRQNINDLEGIVVIGYGLEKKRDLTGSVSSISFDENTQHHINNSTISELTGKLAGVNVITNSGDVDASTTISIRGGSSITQSNKPLIIVDGFPVNDLNDIPFSAIKSIDVLKDAAATAIYGAQGGNGVIIVTTFKGSIGKPKISYNSYYGIRKIANELEVLSPYEYAKLQYEIAVQDNDKLTNYYNRFGDVSDWDIYKQTAKTNWQDKLFGRNAFFTSQNLIVSGGSEKSKYRVDYTYDDNNGIMLGSNLQKHNAGFSFDTKVFDRLKLTLNTRYTNKQVLGAGTASEGSTTTSRLKNAVVYVPFQSFAFTGASDDDYENTSSLYNPIEVTNDDYKKSITNTIRADVGLLADINKKKTIKWETNLGGWLSYNETDRAYGISTSQARNYGDQTLASIKNEKENKFRENSSLDFNIYDNNKHKFKFMFGEELVESNDNYTYNEAWYFPKYISPKEAISNMSLGTAQPITTYEYPSNRTFSLFSRASYDYYHKYLANFTFRADRSNKFADKNQWGFFPAMALAWRFSNESFFKSNIVNDGKLRLSIGASGNNNISNGLYQLEYKAGSANGDQIYFNETNEPYLTIPSVLANPDLKWETNIKRNIGLDFAFFKEKIDLSVDAYYNSTKDLLIQSAIATESGYSSIYRNMGEISNRGIELNMNATLLKTKNWEITCAANISFNHNRIESLGSNQSTLISSGWAGSEISSDYILETGKSTGQMYGYVTDGYYTIDQFTYDADSKTYTLKEGIASDKEILSVGNSFGPGTLRLKDLNGDGVITEDDKTIIGNANPKSTGGLSIKVKYKNIDLGVDAYWSIGNDVYNANKIEYTTTNKYSYRNMTSEMNNNDRWTYVDDNGNYISDPTELSQLNEGHNMWSPIIGRYVFHSWAVEDGSFFRISKLTLGYTLPKDLTLKWKIQSLRIYGCIDNLHCFTKYTGYDPEVNTRNSTPLTPGVDYAAYPRSKAFSLGLNMSL